MEPPVVSASKLGAMEPRRRLHKQTISMIVLVMAEVNKQLVSCGKIALTEENACLEPL
jgi:hypothetical protein